MSVINFVLGALAILSVLVYRNDAASCTSYTQASTCNRTSVCAWSSSLGCYCNSSEAIEVVFVMDSSGSVKSSGWTQEKNFVVGMITSGLSLSSYVGVVQFDDESFIKYKFDQTQSPRSTITNMVKNLNFLQGNTATSSAMIDAFRIFARTTKHKPRIILLLTDGNPNPPYSQNPCDTTGYNIYASDLRQNLTRWNITTVMIAVGPNINPNTLGCLYNYDQSRVIKAADFTEASLKAIRSKTDAYLCPTHTDVRISEVRVETNPGSTGGNARFLELYNNGQIIDFVGNPLVLTGYVTTTINSGSLAQGQYLVIYDNSNSDMKCYNCTCNPTANGLANSNVGFRCTAASYVACSGGGCSFNTAMTNSQWSQRVSDTIDNITFVDITHDSSDTTKNLATVYQGYSFEVIDVLTDSSTGSNWQISCTQYGTPGDTPIKNCSQSCINAICQAAGDSGASCSEGKCSCTASNRYYSTGTECLSLPAPTDCTTFVDKDPYDGFQYGTVVWSDVGITASHYFEVTYTYAGAEYTSTTADGSGIVYKVYGGGSSMVTGNPYPTVKTVIVANGVTVKSANISCPFHTPEPSTSPTRAPTTHPTPKPSVSPSKQPTGKPTAEPTLKPTSPPTLKPTNTPTSYPTISGYQVDSCSIVVARGSESITVTYTYTKHTTLSDTTTDLSFQLNLDGSTALFGYSAVTTSPQTISVASAADRTYYLWPRYYNRVNGSYTGYSRGMNCSITTQEPTPAPTNRPTDGPTRNPTDEPTQKPTSLPTLRPTASPTRRPIQVPECHVLLTPQNSDGQITSVDLTFTEPTLDSETISSSDLIYLVSWGSGSNQQFVVASTGSGASRSESQIDILITWSDTVTITPQDANTEAAQGPYTTCTKSSPSPTHAPTFSPFQATNEAVNPIVGLVFDETICSEGTNNVHICTYPGTGLYSIGVQISPRVVRYNVDFNWIISLDYPSEYDDGFELSSDDVIAASDDFAALSGTGTIIHEEESTTFTLNIRDVSFPDADAEIAWLVLESCSNPADTCTVDPTQRIIRIRISDSSGSEANITKKKDPLPSWVWFPIAAGIVLLAFLAAFGYRYYNQRKLAEEQLQQREAALHDAEELDNLENFGGLGDNINFNPIATAGTQDVATGGEYIDKQLAKQQKNAEFAQVDVDKEVWRQDFGQVKADRHTEV